MKIGFLQFAPIRLDPERNLSLIQSAIAGNTFDVLVLPELADSGYLFEDREELEIVSETANGSGIFLSGLISLAAEQHACIVCGFAEKAPEGIYNSAAAVMENGVLALYRKVHLFNTEKDFFLPGNLGFPVFEFQFTLLGMMICFDWIFPEAARTLAQQGAQIICHPANLVFPYCQAAMTTRSLENAVFSITANRTGSEVTSRQSLHFTGNSQIIGPKGEKLASSSEGETCLKIVEINPELARDKSFTPRNNLFMDRRPDAYSL
jgi:predicted amidohydrolase